MKSTLQAFLTASVLTGVGTAIAHHSFSPVYDGSRTVTVAGVVTDFRLVNPHTQMALDVTDDAGNVTQWKVEFDGRLNLTNHGWNDDTIKVGERLAVTGNPTHTGSKQMFFTRLERSDGSVIARGGNTVQSIENERQRRIEQRRQAESGR
jgi:hypothetical protein